MKRLERDNFRVRLYQNEAHSGGEHKTMGFAPHLDAAMTPIDFLVQLCSVTIAIRILHCWVKEQKKIDKQVEVTELKIVTIKS